MLIELHVRLPGCNTVMHNATQLLRLLGGYYLVPTVLYKLSAVQHRCNLRFHRSECVFVCVLIVCI